MTYVVTYQHSDFEPELDAEFENRAIAIAFAEGVREDGGTASVYDEEGEEVELWQFPS